MRDRSPRPSPAGIRPRRSARPRRAWRLGHLEEGTPDAIAVANADLVIRQSFDGEVLAELPVAEVTAAQPLLPVSIRFNLIDEARSLLATVAAEIALPVTFDIEQPDAPPPLHRLLPDARVHGLSTPLDVARQPDVDREQSGHPQGSSLRAYSARALLAPAGVSARGGWPAGSRAR